jgi:hypothetical protein
LVVRRLEMAYNKLYVSATDRDVELSCYESRVRFAGRIFDPECAIEIAAAA